MEGRILGTIILRHQMTEKKKTLNLFLLRNDCVFCLRQNENFETKIKANCTVSKGAGI